MVRIWISANGFFELPTALVWDITNILKNHTTEYWVLWTRRIIQRVGILEKNRFLIAITVVVVFSRITRCIYISQKITHRTQVSPQMVHRNRILINSYLCIQKNTAVDTFPQINSCLEFFFFVELGCEFKKKKRQNKQMPYLSLTT